MSGFDPKIYWEARLHENYGLHGVGYSGLGRNYNKWMYRVRQRVFFRAVKALSLPFDQSRVLDIGSGTGFYIDCWEKMGVSHIVGVDITPTAVAELTRKYPEHEFHELNIGSDISPLEEGHFDIVSAFDVLFHIVDDRQYDQALQNAYALLKPGGLFILSENPAAQGNVVRPHYVSRSLGYIEHALSRAGFEILSRRPMFILMNYPARYSNLISRAIWKVMATLISLHEVFGYLIGAALYPLELGLLSVVREGLSTDMMICRKPPSSPGASDPSASTPTRL